MTEIQKEPGSGTIIRGADGALYFIRDEILEACRVTEPECLESCTEVLEAQGGDVQGYDFAAEPVTSSLKVHGMIAKPQGSPLASRIGSAASTIMCPWSFKTNPGDVVTNPATQR